jgi:hypothetical protein
MAVFCRQPFPKLAGAFRDVFENWLVWTPEDAKRWACIGPNADEDRPFNSKMLARARAQLDPARAKVSDLCSLQLGGPQETNPDYRFDFCGSRDLEDDETNWLEIRSPAICADATRIEQYVAFVRSVAARLPYASGHASLALVYGTDGQRHGFAQEARRWSFRHPGFDVPDTHGTSFRIASSIRGPFWLTLVGSDALQELGGAAILKRKLPREVVVEEIGAGLMLRTSQFPEIGDVNRRDDLPVLRATARVLEKVTLFNDNSLDGIFVDEDARARWERRHLD